MNLLGAAAAVLMTLSACGDSGNDEPSEPVTIEADGTSTTPKWTTNLDPVTRRTFRCIYGYEDYGYGGGPYIWCYEPEEGELP